MKKDNKGVWIFSLGALLLASLVYCLKYFEGLTGNAFMGLAFLLGIILPLLAVGCCTVMCRKTEGKKRLKWVGLLILSVLAALLLFWGYFQPPMIRYGESVSQEKQESWEKSIRANSGWLTTGVLLPIKEIHAWSIVGEGPDSACYLRIFYYPSGQRNVTISSFPVEVKVTNPAWE